MHRSAIKAAAVTATLLAALSFASPAFADDPSMPPVPTQTSADAVTESANPAAPARLADIKQKGAEAIAKRQVSLSETSAKLGQQPQDCGFNAARASEITTTSANLATLGQQLAATTEVSVARTLYGQIFTANRVYLVVLPKAGKAMRCDAYLGRVAEFNADAAKLQIDIDTAKAAGADTTAAQAQKDAAVATVAGVNPQAAITPCMALVPDNGDVTVKAANAAALKGCDVQLDAVGAAMRNGRTQLAAARSALGSARKTEKVAERTAKKTAHDADVAARKAARTTLPKG